MRARWIHDNPLPDETFLGQTVVASWLPWRHWSISTFQEDSASPLAKLTQSITEGKSYDQVVPEPNGFVTTITQCDRNGWNFSNSLSDKPPLFVREYKNRDEAQAGHKQAVEFLGKGQLHLLRSSKGCTDEAARSTGGAQKCPSCGLINPSKAERCDCGYDFRSKMVKESYSKEPIDPSLQSIGGWLLLFWYTMTVATPILLLVGIFTSSGGSLLVGFGLAFSAFCIYAGITLRQSRPKALNLVKVYLVVGFVLGCAAILSYSTGLHRADGPSEVQTIPGMHEVIYAVIWWSYFKKSKRVRAVFGRNS